MSHIGFQSRSRGSDTCPAGIPSGSGAFRPCHSSARLLRNLKPTRQHAGCIGPRLQTSNRLTGIASFAAERRIAGITSNAASMRTGCRAADQILSICTARTCKEQGSCSSSLRALARSRGRHPGLWPRPWCHPATHQHVNLANV